MHVKNLIKQVTKILVILLFVFSASYSHTALAGTSVVQTFYVPITEEQIRTWETGIYGGTIGNDVNTVVSVTATYNGTIIFYDQWEDGYEDDISNPVQSTTQIWGDGNAANGVPPGCAADACDVVNAGTVIALKNAMPANPRDQGNVFFDGRDKFATTGQLVVTRAGWATNPGTVFSGATEVFDTRKWNTSYESPIGTNSPAGVVGSMFTYTAISILAKENNTLVQVDSNADGTVDITRTLNQGESMMVTNIRQGATVNSSAPVQVDLMTGQTGSNVVGRWFSLIPKNQWSNSYYSPVMTTSAQINSVILYNPDPAATITVNIDTATGPQAPINISPRQVARFNLTTSGAHFYTGGAPFFGVLIGDCNSSTGSTYEWGAMLVPEQDLTPSLVVGWAPGSDGTPPTQNISPVWVTAVANTTLYVDYDGNPSTGSNTDPLGNHYDVSYNVTALQSQIITDTDNDMTGARIYTVNNTRIAAAWGQNTATDVPGTPALDLGTAVLPFPSLTAYKTAALIGDYNSNGGLDAGELLQYTIRVHNSGIYPITNIVLTDTLDPDVTYVADTSTIGGVTISDDVTPKTRFPFDETGYMIVTSPAMFNPGDDIYITFEVTANNPLPLGKSSITNNAKVSSVAEIFLNTQTEVVQQGVLETVKTSSAAGTEVKPGDTITYTVTVTNTSSTPQTGIQLNDPLPAGTSYEANSTTVTGHRQKLVMDKFNQLLFSNNDGPENWTLDPLYLNWVESEADGPTAGNVQVINGALRLTVNGSYAKRTADLTTGIPGQNFTSATLSFDFRTSPGVDATDATAVEISGDGTAFTTLETFTGVTGQTSGVRTYDVSSYISPTTTVRFRVTAGFTGANEYFYPDNIAIKTNELPIPVTKDNITGGANPDLKSGVPPALVRQDDGFTLAGGETMTIIYRVRVNNPVNETRIVNTATATSYEKAPPAASTTIDTVSTGGTIGDLVWLDTVVNGIYDYGEPGLYNVRVWLDTNNNNVFDSGVDFETRTGTDGKYVFDGLLPGTYKVFVDETTVPTGLSYTTGTVNPSATITITGEDTVLSTDFGYKTADSSVAIIGNYIWSDANNNGLQDSGEVGIGGVTVELRASPGGAVVQTATTNAFGIYLFTNVSAGTYTVTVTDTANKLSVYTATTGLQSLGKAVGVPSDPLTVTGGNSYMMMDFGYYNLSLFSISNKLWFDSDGNGIFSPGEPGIKDVTVTLLDSTGNVMGATASDVNGNFYFTGVPDGSYTIRIEDATGNLIGYAGTTSAAQAGALSVQVAGANVSGTAFGYNAPGRIGDTVWNDLDRDGIQDTGEPGIQGVTVQLYKDTNGDGVFNPAVDQLTATTTTDSYGNYMFQVSVAGRFFVNIDNTQSALSGLTLTTRDDETYQGVQIQVDFLNLNTSLLTADFGFSAPATIGGVVWNDTNRNGSEDSGETGIQGVSVKIYKDTISDGVFNPATDQLLSTLITDANGHYAFPVTEAGRYFISIDDNQTPLLGKTLTTGDDQTYAGAQITVNLPDANTFYTNGNFGYGPPAPSALSVTKSADPSGNVYEGNTITYTINVTNTSATRQTGIIVNDPLPANTTYVVNSTSATGSLPPSSSITRDNFESQNYSGGTGSWVGSWSEIGENNGPAQDQVRVLLDTGDYSARIRRQPNYGLQRTVNLSACSSSTISFDYLRSGLEAGKGVRVYAYNGTTETQLWDSGSGTDVAYLASPNLSIPYLIANSIIRFRSYGLSNNNDLFYFDNVQIVCNVPKTTQTKTNYVGTTNPLSNGVPPNLVVPADSFILDQNETLTVTFQVRVDNPLPPDVDKIINQATVTSNESSPAIGSVTNIAPVLHDLQVTKTIDSISDPCTVGTCQVTYLVTVTNVGRYAPETGIKVTDNLPSELQYVSSTPSQGSYADGIWSVGTLSLGASATLQIISMVTGDSSSIQNCASLTDSTYADTNPYNNTSCASFTPTSVILSDFRAYADNGRVVIEWTTASENNTAGFYLFRKDDTSGEYQLINDRLLPALLTSPQGGTYSLIDNGASPEKSYMYILMEIQGKGKKNVYGPFTVQSGIPGFMDNHGVSNTVSPDALLNKSKELKSLSEQINKYINKDGVLVITNKISSKQGNTPYGGKLFSNYTRKAKDTPDSREALLKAMKENRESLVHISAWPVGNNTPLKISVSQDGLYSVSASAISAALGQSESTIRFNIARNKVSLTIQEQSVAYTTTNDYSKILFYGHGIDSIYSDKNIYWLSMETGLKMENGPRVPGPASIGGDLTFTDTIHAEKDAIIVPVLINDPEADYWFWDIVVSGDSEYDSTSFTIQANGAANSSSEATLNANLYGFTEIEANHPDYHEHHAMIYLNDNFIGDGEWDGAEPHTVTLHFNQAWLINGANTIKVKGVLNDKVPYSEFWIDSFDLTYERVYQAVNNTLICRGDGNPVVTITGFTGPAILLLDITDSMRPKIVNAATITGTNGLYSVRFTPLSPETVYLAVLRGAETAVSELKTGKSTGLMNKSNNADYLIITTPELVNASQSLADYRKAQGLTPKIIVLENIMNEFNYGIYDPRAIRNFLSYAYHNWTKPPKYLVLAGNGTYDYKDNMDRGDNLVPTLMTDTTVGLYASDNLYAVFDGNPVPMIAIGRLPVLTAGELQDIVAKIISYESGTGNNALLLADDPDDGGNFPNDSDAVAALLPQRYTVDKIYLSQYPVAQAKSLLLEKINSGAVFLNYIGHAGPDRLAFEGLLTKDDITLMHNAGGPHVLTAMTCLAGQFAIPGFDSLSESLVLKKDAGSAAVWAPTGYSYNWLARTLDEEFLKAAFGAPKTVLGNAILNAFREYNISGGQPFMINIYTLFGDPALKLR